MQNKNKFKYLVGEIYVEVVVGENPDGETEVHAISDISFMLGKGAGPNIQENLMRYFKDGKDVAAHIMDEVDTLKLLIYIQDRQDKEQEARDRAEDSFANAEK